MKSLATSLLFLLALGGGARGQNGKGSEAGDGPGAVVVVNDLGRPVTIWIGGELRGKVEAGSRATFANVPSGRLSLQAGAAGSLGPVAGEDRALGPGETFTWTLYPVLAWEEERGVGTLVLVNGLDREVQVFLADQPAGALAPGASRAYPRIAAGEVALRAEDAGGALVEGSRLTVEPGHLVRWRIDAQPDSGAADASTPSGASDAGTPSDAPAGTPGDRPADPQRPPPEPGRSPGAAPDNTSTSASPRSSPSPERPPIPDRIEPAGSE